MKEERNIFKARRSIFCKEFTGKRILKSVVLNCLENAHFAPSHKLTLPWVFVLLNAKQQQAFFNACLNEYLENTDNVDLKKVEKIKIMAKKTGYVVGIKCKFSGKVPEWEEIAAVGAAVQNIYLSLNNYENIGGYWSSGLGTNGKMQREFWQCKENELHMGFFVFGHVLNKRKTASRAPLSLNMEVKRG